ncbi:MAG TPA: flavodoxin family protein [Proteobacteria bacterium]|nr:flavodoxin family protein [Pseudomonadota bacterium]
MKILGVSGSPNKKGNNEKAIELALKVAQGEGAEIKKIFLSRVKVGPCLACPSCKREEKCLQEDDFNDLIPLITEADGLIISSPVYMGSVCGQLKCLLDRTVFLRRKDFHLRGKLGAAIAIGGSRNGGQEITIQAIHAWMHIHGMIVVGDDNHFGGIAQAPIGKDEEGRRTIEATARKLCQTLRRLTG